MRILLLSAYNTTSHNYWCSSLIKNFPEYNWDFLKLPPRKFSWRIRGNPLSWLALENDKLKGHYDTVIATSMVDLATIIGLYPNLGNAKKVYYFHENQFEYPLSNDKQHSNVESMMVNLYGALSADLVVFNSNYNKGSFFEGAGKFLKKINDHSPVSILEGINAKAIVLPVPICERLDEDIEKIPYSIVWNHRWEYDKNPNDFYKALKILRDNNVGFKLIMMGIQFKNSPEAFNKIRRDFSENILCWGEQSKQDYVKWLKKSSFIVSTALHEFQGLAIMEGVQMGATPIVPNRLSYPQWFPKENIFGNTPKELAKKLISSFNNTPGIPKLDHLTWESLKPEYKKLIKK